MGHFQTKRELYYNEIPTFELRWLQIPEGAKLQQLFHIEYVDKGVFFQKQEWRDIPVVPMKEIPICPSP